MPERTNSWFGKLWDRLEAAHGRLRRPCPKCGGDLYRIFSIPDKIGLFIPFPHTLYANHQCDTCQTYFRSFRCLTDLFLEVGWTTGFAYLGEWKPLALVCPITWLITSHLIKPGSRGLNDTVGAGVLTGILWLLVLVFGNQETGDYLMSHSVIMFTLGVCLTLGPVWIVLILDKYTSFRLREC